MERIILCSDCGLPVPAYLLPRRTRSPLCGGCYYYQVRKPYLEKNLGAYLNKLRRWSQSPGCKRATARYAASAKGKFRQDKYRSTQKYRDTVGRYENSERRKTLKILWEGVGRWAVPSRQKLKS